MHIRILMMAVVSSLLLPGCAETPLKVKPIAKTENPAERIATLGAAVGSAQKGHVDVLSPVWFSRARQSYLGAKNGLDKGAQLSVILNNVALGQAQLKQAEKYAEQSRFHLKEVIRGRQLALQANADRYRKDFAEIEDDFKRLTASIEKGDVKYALKHQDRVNKAYRALELRAIKGAALDNVRRLLQILEDKDADEIAPRSFAEAREKLAAADAFISKNRYDKAGIEARAEKARFFAERVQHIAETIRKLEDMAPESIALQIESYLHQTSNRLDEPDRRNVSFDIQQENNINAISVLQNSYELSLRQVKSLESLSTTLNRRVAESQNRTDRVKADKERLAAEKRFNELFTRVQNSFSSSEAEVYKQSGQLVIRLKAMQFPVGQAVIMPGNYDLLTKVQRAIQTFGQPDVIIEGHTDSTGSPAKNEQLSQLRATSVRKYLIANNTLSPRNITAVGYGSQRPLASNQTAVGRAINRRIDVVIRPRK